MPLSPLPMAFCCLGCGCCCGDGYPFKANTPIGGDNPPQRPSSGTNPFKLPGEAHAPLPLPLLTSPIQFSGRTSTTNFHLGHGLTILISLMRRSTNSSSFSLLCLEYNTTTILPTDEFPFPIRLQIGNPNAVLIPDCIAPPRRSKRCGGAFITNCSQAGMPDW